MALLWLSHEVFPGRCWAATVDHGLRPEARDEAEMVAARCGSAGIPHAILTPSEPISGSIQSAARAVRYALLDKWRRDNALDWLMTAHHADDQLETVLMRLNRASGVAGLAGVRARNGLIVRPLLGWRRAELEALVRDHGLPHAHDPSNADCRFDRVNMRQRLADIDWLDPIAASRSASACADADEALQWMVAKLAREHIQCLGNGSIVLDRYDFPRELQRRLIHHMLQLAEPDAEQPRGDTIDQAVVQLLCGKKVSIGRWLLTGGERWILSPAPPRTAR